MSKTEYVKKTPAEKQAESREALAAAVESMGTSEGFHAWLRTRAMFRQYSFGNTMLIATQCPHATHVAGFKTWQSLARQVRKGEHGIRIFAPMIFGGKTITAEAENVRTAETEVTELTSERRMAFRLVSVFDVSQTDGEPLPELEIHQLEGDSPDGMRNLLETVATSLGLTVTVEDLRDGLGGFYDRKGARIVLAAGCDGAHEAHTLAHELGHALDPWLTANPDAYGEHRGDCEAVAESVAYVICSHFGLDAGPAAIGYVASWCNGDAKRVRNVAERIDIAVRSILKPALAGVMPTAEAA